MSNDTLLVCYRVRRGYFPKLVSKLDHCSECGVPVWRALSSPPEAQAICLACMTRNFKEGDVIEPPSTKQIREITEYFKRDGN